MPARSGVIRLFGSVTLSVLCLGTFSACQNSSDGVGQITPAAQTATPSAPTALDATLDSLGVRIGKAAADQSVRQYANVLQTRTSALSAELLAVRTSLKGLNAFHKRSPKDCSGGDELLTSLTLKTDEATATASQTKTAAAALDTAATKLGSTADGLAIELQKVSGEATANRVSIQQLQRIESYSTTIQALTALKSSTNLLVKNSLTSASDAVTSSQRQAAAGQKIVSQCQVQAAAREKARSQAIAKAKAAANARQRAEANARLKAQVIARQKADANAQRKAQEIARLKAAAKAAARS